VKKPKTKFLFRLIGIGIFIYIISKVDSSKIINQYRNADTRLILISSIIIAVFILTKSLRWKAIANIQGIHLSLKESIMIYTSSLYLGIITPGRIGDFAKSYYIINNKGIPIGKALFSSLADRLFDLFFIVLAGYISLIFFPNIFQHQFLFSTLMLIVILSILIILIRKKEILIKLINSALPKSKFKSTSIKLSNISRDLIHEFALFNAKNLAFILTLTLVAWACHYTFFILSAHSLKIETSISNIIISISAAIFMSLLPISIAGFGTRDIALIIIFSRIGLSKEQAITFSLSFVLVYIIIGLLGFICWMISPIEIKTREEGGMTRDA